MKICVKGLLPLVAAVGILAAAGPLLAQNGGYGRIVYSTEKVSVRPYFLGYVGVGNPNDAAFDLVFDQPMVRFGGGFGILYGHFGSEILIRQGTSEDSHMVSSSTGGVTPRNFMIKTTEAQLRFYGEARVKSFSFPAGIGIGFINMTADRGYTGVFDRFGGTGFFAGPFAGVQYKLGESFLIGFEGEYAFGNASFDKDIVWHRQNIDRLDGFVNSTTTDFWDTVGGSQAQDFDSGGFNVCVRMTILLPALSGSN